MSKQDLVKLIRDRPKYCPATETCVATITSYGVFTSHGWIEEAELIRKIEESSSDEFEMQEAYIGGKPIQVFAVDHVGFAPFYVLEDYL